jgi:hypothetical protein
MRRRKQTLVELDAELLAIGINCANNIEFYGLKLGQIVHVRSKGYTGPAKLTGTPPQGAGIYAVTPQGNKLWIDGEDISEATEPS